MAACKPFCLTRIYICTKHAVKMGLTVDVCGAPFAEKQHLLFYLGFFLCRETFYDYGTP